MERAKEDQYDGCTLYLFKNRTNKPVEIVLSRRVRGWGK
jgi:hypothetical protein